MPHSEHRIDFLWVVTFVRHISPPGQDDRLIGSGMVLDKIIFRWRRYKLVHIKGERTVDLGSVKLQPARD